MNKTTQILTALIALAILLPAGSAHGTAINSAQSGNWTDGGTWVDGVVPTNIDDVAILNSHTVTVTDVTTHYVKSLTIQTNAVLTHGDNSTAEDYKVILNVTSNLTIDLGGKINVMGKGYDRCQGPGKGNGTGDYGGGGGHGGEGADGRSATGGTTYGSITAPTNIGSGAGSNAGGGGPSYGGGAVILEVTGTTTVEGTISADATPSGYARYAGAAGGSVFITTGNIAGSGTITANGNGGTHSYPGNGGGGRIAIILTSETGFGNVTLQAYGGSANARAGGAGTIYKKASNETYGTLIVDNNSKSTSATTLISSLVTEETAGNVIIQNAGSLKLDDDQSFTVNGDFTNNGTFTADTGSSLIISGTGTSTICGSTTTNTFANLACVTSNKVINFLAGSTFVVTEGLTFTGTAGNLIDLNSTSPGTEWFLTLQAGALQSVSYVEVQDSNASNGDAIGALDSTNVDNNTNWGFSGAVITWTGAMDTDWGTAGNWDLNRLPIYVDTDIIIPDITNDPVLDGNREIPVLTIQPGGHLSLGGYNLTVNGNADIDGTLTATGTDTVTFKGNADFTDGAFVEANSTVMISGSGAQLVTVDGNSFYEVIVANTSATVTFQDAVAATTFANQGADITFGSDLTATYFYCESGPVTMMFQEGSDYDIAYLVIRDSFGNTITLRSSTGGQQWNLNVSGWCLVRHVDAQDANASGGTEIHAINSTNSNNNTNWDFSTWLVWDGSESSNFGTANNWTPATIPVSTSLILIDGNYTSAPVVSSETTVSNIVIGREVSVLTLSADLTVNQDMIIHSGSTLTHSDNSIAETYKLDLTVGRNLTLAMGGKIDVTGRGYDRCQGLGKGNGTGDNGGGGGHGGEGSDGSSATGGSTYGSATAPTNIGSGAGSGSGGGGPSYGGGAVILDVTGTTTVEGTISADATPSGYELYAGAAGGSVFITTGNIAGSGTITANGNGGTSSGPGNGGGGRISLILTAGTDFGNITLQAYGGSANARAGGAGTIYQEPKNGGSSVIVDNNTHSANVVTRLPPDIDGITTELENASLIVTNYGKAAISTNAWVGDILIYTNSSLTLTNFYLHVDSMEHSLEDLTDKHPDASTNRVDHYNQILWEGLPPPSVLIFR